MDERVKLLGYRMDVRELLQTADVFAHPSFREGLPVAVMEAMAAGLPVICSNIRGNSDLIAEGQGGFFVSPKDVSGFTTKLERLLRDTEMRNRMSS